MVEPTVARLMLPPAAGTFAEGALHFQMDFRRAPFKPPWEFLIAVVWSAAGPVDVTWETRVYSGVRKVKGKLVYGPRLGEIFRQRKASLIWPQAFSTTMGVYNVLWIRPKEQHVPVLRLAAELHLPGQPRLLHLLVDVRSAAGGRVD